MMRENQKDRAETHETIPEDCVRNMEGYGYGDSNITARRDNSCSESQSLMEKIVERENMFNAYYKVVGNRGSSGIDNMSVEELKPYLQENWPSIKEELLQGTYSPCAVLRVEIPKPGGKGVRKLGIPTVLDRLIQQALNQMLSSIFEEDFSDNSYGFRPRRSAHDAVLNSRDFVSSGKRWVVDLDLEKFFDTVNHDILMSRIHRKVKDKRVLTLIRRYLQSGIMENGMVKETRQGTPQGGPLSPLLSNIILDDLDKELEKRGHSFCRYADDCNIYVSSKKSGERVMKSITVFLERRLKLKVNREKSGVGRPWNRSFLGYSMTWHMKPKLKVSKKSIRRFKSNLKTAFRRGRGRNIQNFIKELRPILLGWINYFCLSEVKGIFEELDGWIRRRLRNIIWRQLKRARTRARKLIHRGLSEKNACLSAGNGRGAWWNSGASHMNRAFPKSYFDRCGLVSFLDEILKFQCSS
jgi:RNA-directed DNA polymerase